MDSQKNFNNIKTSRDRLSALTDGIYAIAMTIMVLEIIVPATIGSYSEFNYYLTNTLIPDVFFYFISFIILANLWSGTNDIIMLKKIDKKIFATTMASLCFICLIPFSTSLVCNYWIYPQSEIIFGINIFVIGLCNFLKYYFSFKNELIKEKINEKLDPYKKSILLSNIFIMILSISSILLAFIHPIMSMGLYILIILINFTLKLVKG